jgi:phenylacetate-CoA ligase
MTSSVFAGRQKVLLVGPKIPPYGGVALQARLLLESMSRDGVHTTLAPSNPDFPNGLSFLEQLRGVRPLLRSVVFSWRLWKQLPEAYVVHILACSWVYFFVVVCPAVLLGRARGKRIVVNYRGGEAREFFRRFGWLIRPIFKMADVITAPSDFLGQVIRQSFGVTVRIVPNILNLPVFPYRQRVTFQPRMLVTRHLEKLYDIESSLKAFRVIQEHHPEASLWIAGTGSQEAYLRGLVSTWNLRNVRFLGHVPHGDLPAIYDYCDILLNASLADNFPGALLEASAAGLAVVSTGVGGIPFIYRDGLNALLVQPGDWQGLAQAVEKLLASPTLGMELTAAAASVARSCDWKEVRRPLYEAYGFSLANQPARNSVFISVKQPDVERV